MKDLFCNSDPYKQKNLTKFAETKSKNFLICISFIFKKFISFQVHNTVKGVQLY